MPGTRHTSNYPTISTCPPPLLQRGQYGASRKYQRSFFFFSATREDHSSSPTTPPRLTTPNVSSSEVILFSQIVQRKVANRSITVHWYRSRTLLVSQQEIYNRSWTTSDWNSLLGRRGIGRKARSDHWSCSSAFHFLVIMAIQTEKIILDQRNLVVRRSLSSMSSPSRLLTAGQRRRRHQQQRRGKKFVIAWQEDAIGVPVVGPSRETKSRSTR